MHVFLDGKRVCRHLNLIKHTSNINNDHASGRAP